MLPADWVLRYEETIPIVPQTKQRPRTIRASDGSVKTYTPKKTADFEKAVARWIRGAFTVRAGRIADRPKAVKLEVLCVFARPQSMCRKVDPSGYIFKPSSPDASNLLKSIEDGIEKAQTIFKDDAQIVDAHIQKVYGDKEQTPEIKIWIYTLKGDE